MIRGKQDTESQNQRKAGEQWTPTRRPEAEEREAEISRSQNVVFCYIQILQNDDRSSIIELKKTDMKTKERKDKTWAAVRAEFCAQGGGADRTVDQLKGIWKRMKETAKKEKTEEKKEIRRTGVALH